MSLEAFAPFAASTTTLLEAVSSEARRMGDRQVLLEHLLLGVINLQNAQAGLLQRLWQSRSTGSIMSLLPGVTTKKIESILHRQRIYSTEADDDVPGWSTAAQQALQLASEERYWADHRDLALEHLLLGILRTPHGRAVLHSMGVIDFTDRLQAIRAALFAEPEAPARRQRSRYTRSAKLAISFAQDEAREHRHQSVNTAHLLIGLARDRDSLAAHILRNLGADAERIRGRVLQMQPPNDRDTEVIGLAESYKRVLDRASNERHLRKHARLATGHLLYHVALLDEEDIALRALRRCEVRPRDIFATMQDYVQTQLNVLEGIGGADIVGASVMFTLTFESQRNFEVALEEAERLGHRVLDTSHLLMGLMIDESSLTATIFAEYGIDRRRVRALIEVGNTHELHYQLQPRRLADDLRTALQLAIDAACVACHYAVVNPLHLLLALLRQHETPAQRVLQQLGVDLAHLKSTVIMHLERIRT